MSNLPEGLGLQGVSVDSMNLEKLRTLALDGEEIRYWSAAGPESRGSCAFNTSR